eukprot:TRINITY_DN2794_c0_g1_i4.p1 TRINITY_DN2794_c0_g1~~TRINITY_DN2794_c0_g1_i4.p1  ORF type:complete len:467 (-),score=98.26 TRINITY_DN2794_c0_g1_i4:239-1639(-)
MGNTILPDEQIETREVELPVFVKLPNDPSLNKWMIVEELLSAKISDENELIDLCSKLAPPEVSDKAYFFGLTRFFEVEFKGEEKKRFFDCILPEIQNLALNLPYLVSSSIPILSEGTVGEVTLSQRSISSLLACAFFGLIPPQAPELDQLFPDPNLALLFRHPEPQVYSKIRMIINYFDRVTTRVPTGYVSFIRKQINIYKETPEVSEQEEEDVQELSPFSTTKIPPKTITKIRSDMNLTVSPVDWETSEVKIDSNRVKLDEEGVIEDDYNNDHIDFANSFLGGGVLERGCVQEEIRFSLCPECLVGMVFCSRLKANEAIVIKGAERYSSYSGYGRSLKYAGDYTDNAEIDEQGRLKNTIIAIDAVNFMGGQTGSQFSKNNILRELNKAYCGFHPIGSDDIRRPIATGNWGCGAFLGDVQLKSLIQILAAAQVDRDVIYYSFKNEDVRGLTDVLKVISTTNQTVGM